jgi:tetratricopeptide (TPR) repeat protein
MPHRNGAGRPAARRPGPAIALAALLALLGVAALLRWRATHAAPRAAAVAPAEDEAAARLQAAVEARPTGAAARLRLGEYEEGQGHPFAAMWEYAEARRLAPAETALPLRLAAVLRAAGAVDLATAQLVEALQARPDALELRRELAGLHLATAEPQRARSLLEARREAVWRDASAVLILGRARQASGDDAGAMAAFQRALALESQSPEAFYRRGRLELRQGQFDEARDAFFRALLYDPRRPEYPFYAGMTCLRQPGPQSLARASRFFRDTLALRPNDAPAHYEAGVALERMGRRSPALTQYSMATVADPQATEPLPALSRALAAAGRTPDAHHFLGRYYDLKDRPVEAIREYERMQAAAPESVEPALLIGQVYVRTLQSEKAIAVTGAALKRHPHDPELIERLAVLKINRGDWAAARRLLQEWLAVEPKASRPCWLLGRCAIGELKYPEAVSWLEKAVALEPRNPHYLGFLGAGLLKLGTPAGRERAAGILAQAVSLAPNEAEYRDLYGQTLQQLGRYDEARRQFLQALDADPTRIATYLALTQLAGRLRQPGAGAFLPTVIRSAQRRANEETLLQPYVWRHPEDVAGRLKLARFLCRTARLTQARDQLEQALAQQPASTDARQLLQTVQRSLDVQ